MIRRTLYPVIIPGPTDPDGGTPRPPRPRIKPRTILFTGADGSTWDLTNGPVTLGRGVRGLVPGDVENIWQGGTSTPGATYRGFQHPGPEDVVLPVHITAPPGAAWRDLDDRFKEALFPGVQCRVTVVAQDGTARWRPIYLVGPGVEELDVDPEMLGHLTLRPRFEAPDPFWRGAYEPVELTPTPDFPTLWQHVGGVMNLAPRSARGSAVLRNDGDVPAFPRITASGPMGGFTAGVDAAIFEYGEIPAGATVHVDMHPTMHSVGFTEGTNSEQAWAGVKRRAFTGILPRSSAAVTLQAIRLGVGARLAVEVPKLHYWPTGRQR